MENVSEIFWVRAAESIPTPWISFTGGLRLYVLPSSCIVQNCNIVLFMLFVSHLMFGTCDKNAVEKPRGWTHTQTKHKSFIFILSFLGSQVRTKLIINNRWVGTVVFDLSAFEPLLTTRWTKCGRVNRIRWHFCHERPPLISLHLLNKGWHHPCLQHTFLRVKNETCSFAF